MIYGTNDYHLPIILVFYIPWHRPAWKLFIIPTNTEYSTIMRDKSVNREITLDLKYAMKCLMC
jgi:hypothetical protein